MFPKPRKYKHPKLIEFIKTVRPETVVEFGSWYGKSAIAMALAAKDEGIEHFRIYAVDTWLGSIENWKRETGAASKQDLHLTKSGRPQFYDQFLRNVQLAGVSRMIIPLSMTTDTAYRWLEWKNIKADLIYIDAAHTNEEVKADIDRARHILADKGLLCGDDYWHEDGVVQAVHEKIGAGNFQLKGNFWWQTKHSKL